ncbi:hypothetical protein B0H16DRAFT_1509447 [Mycena metata]|uniref:Uncharacterized protein n=1 Tax=Mycena metata TaxID=1033252 RepID=A0AAD7JZJ2_9AGAR|nr:hypothetical protein B0H16DRAFT_1509447 [Mycena metata]
MLTVAMRRRFGLVEHLLAILVRVEGERVAGLLGCASLGLKLKNGGNAVCYALERVAHLLGRRFRPFRSIGNRPAKKRRKRTDFKAAPALSQSESI